MYTSAVRLTALLTVSKAFVTLPFSVCSPVQNILLLGQGERSSLLTSTIEKQAHKTNRQEAFQAPQPKIAFLLEIFSHTN